MDMRELDDHLEVVITEADVDEDWQLKDLGSTLRPYVAKTRMIDVQMVDALKSAPSPGQFAGRSALTGRV